MESQVRGSSSPGSHEVRGSIPLCSTTFFTPFCRTAFFMLQRPGCTPSGRSASGSRTEVRFALASRPPGAPRAFSLRHVCKCWDMHRGIEPRRGEQPSGLFTKERRRRDVSRRERSEAAGASPYALHDTPRGGNIGSGPSHGSRSRPRRRCSGGAFSRPAAL